MKEVECIPIPALLGKTSGNDVFSLDDSHHSSITVTSFCNCSSADECSNVGCLDQTSDTCLDQSSETKVSDEDEEDIDEPTMSNISKKSVCFHTIQIREYQRELGDNPSVSCGPPVSISWKYDKDREMLMPLEDFERARCNFRRVRNQLVMPRYLREDILVGECGVSPAEMAHAIRMVNKTRAQRRTTINNLGDRVERMELAIETARKICTEIITCKNEKREVRMLLQQSRGETTVRPMNRRASV